MSISTYQNSSKSTLLRTLTKKNIAQYIFDTGSTQHSTIDRYSMSGKDFFAMLSSDEQFHHISLDSTHERQIYLEISDKKIVDSDFIDFEYYDGIINLSPHVVAMSEYDNVIICFKDDYVDKIHLLSVQNAYQCKRTIFYCAFKLMMKYIIIILQWIFVNI